MSGFIPHDPIWIGDLDSYISIDEINYWNRKEEEEQTEHELYESTNDIYLLGGTTVKPPWLKDKKISISDWEFEIYRARCRLQEKKLWRNLEPLLVNAIISEGRNYAVRRYAKSENIPINTALTATIQNGIQALISKFYIQHQIAIGQDIWQNLTIKIQDFENLTHITAYDKTTLIRNTIFDSIYKEHQHPTKLKLNELRILLSAIRLYYSYREIRVSKFSYLKKIENKYKIEKEKHTQENNDKYNLRTGNIKNWKIRHLRSLLYYYPYEFRNTIDRGQLESEMTTSKQISEAAVNELALLYCAINKIKLTRLNSNDNRISISKSSKTNRGK